MRRCTSALIVMLLAGCSQDQSAPHKSSELPAPWAESTDGESADAGSSSSNVSPAVTEHVDPTETSPSTTVEADPEIAAFLEGDAEQRARLDSLLANPSLPPFSLSQWHNSEELDWSRLEGKLVLLDFWATWCGPCIRSIPHNNDLARRYTGEVVIIGVCAPRGAENLEETIEKHSIEYPVAVDTGSAWNDHFSVNGFPDYYLIGRNGELLAADIANSQVDAALVHFLNQ